MATLPEGLLVVSETLADRLRNGAGEYAAAAPWPHLVLQDALPPQLVSAAYDQVKSGELVLPIQRKGRRHSKLEQPDLFGAAAEVLSVFESAAVVQAVGELIGVGDLSADPSHVYAGLQVTPHGGQTKVHIDFERHPTTNLFHRANLLLYLNPHWDVKNGGALELWPADMASLGRKIVPRCNQVLVFESGSHTPHGLPDPVALPEGPGRVVLSSYYYSPAAQARTVRRRLSVYRARPGDSRLDGLASVRELVRPIWFAIPIALRNRLHKPR